MVVKDHSNSTKVFFWTWLPNHLVHTLDIYHDRDMVELYLAALIAEIAGTIAGFGSSSILLPVAHQYLSYHNALVLVAIYHIFGNVSRFSFFRRHRNKKVFLLFGIPSIIFTIAWAYLAGIINPDVLKIILGSILILFAIYSMTKKHLRLPLTKAVGIIWWWLSWFSAGLIGTWGVLRWAFMNSFGLSKESYIATIASVALLVDFTRIPVYFGQWFLDTEHLKMIPVLFIIAFVGSWIGKKVIKRIPWEQLRTFIYIAIILASSLLMYQWIMAIYN